MLVDKKYNILKPIKTSNLIRLGGNSDGGYVVNSDIIKKTDNLVSFGMGTDWSFELDYIKKNKNILIYIYDHTVSSTPYVKDIFKYLRRLMTFRSNFKAVLDRVSYYLKYKNFLFLKNVNFFKEKITDKIRIKTESDINKVFSRIDNKNGVVLKCDIEGDEYKIVDKILEQKNRLEMLITEFHWIDKNEELFLKSIRKIKDHFEIIHIHGNNHFAKGKSGLPIIMEITFLNKKYIQDEKIEYIKHFPIDGLDYPCNRYKEDLTFSFE